MGTSKQQLENNNAIMIKCLREISVITEMNKGNLFVDFLKKKVDEVLKKVTEGKIT